MLKSRQRWSWRTVFASAVTAVLWASPVRAAAVDFDGDGVSDELHLSTQLRTEIIITVSASKTTHVLRLRETPLSIVAADVDHDGTLDVSTLSPRHGLRVWLNRGRLGFFRMHRKTPPPRAPVFRDRGSQLNGSSGDGAEAGQSSSFSPVGIECAAVASPLPPVTTPLLPARSIGCVLDRAGVFSSRAPPTRI
jgi:hypothetical protein